MRPNFKKREILSYHIISDFFLHLSVCFYHRLNKVVRAIVVDKKGKKIKGTTTREL